MMQQHAEGSSLSLSDLPPTQPASPLLGLPAVADLRRDQIMDDNAGQKKLRFNLNDSNGNALNPRQCPGKMDSTISTPSTLSSLSSIVAQWFDLETTAEDRLSWNIITTELKDLAMEIFCFLKDRNWKKKFLTVLVLCVSCSVFYDLLQGDHSVLKHWIDELLLWMTHNPTTAEFVFVAIYALATLVFIPPTMLHLGAGWAFTIVWKGAIDYGVVAAVVACFAGSILGALASFLRARYMMRDLIELFARRYPIVKAADQALQRDGLRIMLLLRLCPLIPFHSLNYLGGITQVSWKTFTLSLIGILPNQIIIIVMGASAGSLAYARETKKGVEASEKEFDEDIKITHDQQKIPLLGITILGIATFIIALVLAFRYTKKELQKVRRLKVCLV
jgi:uncharacterized membrane protein YdjX (TVP38/TMEM64 family)